jgi:hypothetical protein
VAGLFSNFQQHCPCTLPVDNEADVGLVGGPRRREAGAFRTAYKCRTRPPFLCATPLWRRVELPVGTDYVAARRVDIVQKDDWSANIFCQPVGCLKVTRTTGATFARLTLRLLEDERGQHDKLDYGVQHPSLDQAF